MPANAMNFFEAGFDFIPDVLNGDANSDLTGDRINLKNYERAYILLQKPAGTAGDDLSIALQQHDAASSGNSKALTFDRWWYKKGTMSAQGTWTAVEESTAVSDLDLGTPTDYGFDDSAAVVLVEVRADSLDGAGGYTFVSVNYEGDDIGNALVVTSGWILMGNRYAQAIPLTSLA